MKDHSASVHRFYYYILLAGLFLLTSCQTYKFGFWGKLPDSGTSQYLDNDSARKTLQKLAQQKKQLTKESFVISAEMLEKLNSSTPITAHTFNLLFGNLHEQYEIDTLYHQFMQQNPNKSVREQSKQALLESALNYKKAFQQNKFIRRTINRGDIAYGIPTNTLTQTQQFLWSDKNNRQYLIEHIKDKKTTQTKAGFLLSNAVDNFHSAQYKTTYFLSMIFGRFTGQFHGHIDKKTNAMLLKSHLQEFDLVFLKSITHLTEKFIPGYFGHVGVYLGNDQMIEAPRSGVRTSTTEEFSDGEIFLIVRPVNLSGTQKQKIRSSLKSQVGKKYDYNFDTQSPDRVVCSELVSLAYDFIDWQTEKIVGRYTISPDDLIRTLLKRTDFTSELYLNQGKFITQPDSTFIQKLLNSE